jgi:hypothetical protein
VADAFLRYSPRLATRGEWLFADVASTSRLFKGEAALLADALQLAQAMGFKCDGAAIADTPSGAQALAASHQSLVCSPGEERAYLQPLPLPLLLQLEGLEPWPQASRIEGMVDFFQQIGFRQIGELERFAADSMRERWGEAGELAWRRLRALDRVPISPFIPTEPLREGGHLDFPISLASLLMHALRRPLERLFARLQGRGLYAEKAVIELRGEYSSAVRRIELEPCSPSRKLDLFMTLLERKLGENGLLDDPVRAFDISISTRPERERQLDFFEPRETDTDRLESLVSVLLQGSARVGFLKPRPALLPERAWSSQEGWEATRQAIERERCAPGSDGALGRSYRLEPLGPAERKALLAPPTPGTGPGTDSSAGSGTDFGAGYENPAFSVRPLPEYGTDVMEAPRPTRLLEAPTRLSQAERRAIKILSENPIERLESDWWKDGPSRDYHFAISAQGQCLWIFRNQKDGEWFLHGYFD